MKYLITGGTGFIGSSLVESLSLKESEIIILSRYNNSNSDNIKYIKSLEDLKNINDIDVIINLAGSSINRRWSKKVKKDIISSRVDVTKKLINFLQAYPQKNAIMINASAIGFYGPQGEVELVEESQFLNSYTHEVCSKWENEANLALPFIDRLCVIRLGVVLGKGGGVLKEMHLPFSLGLGGKLGSGSQIFSWIHMSDVIAGIDFLINNKKSSGIYNFTSPKPVTNKEFIKAIGNSLHRPTFFSMPEFVVKFLFGEMGDELLLKGQKVIPKKLIDEGFVFNYNDVNSAVTEVFI